MWLRSMLTDEPAHAGGGDWDAETPPRPPVLGHSHRSSPDTALMPTLEEILRAWAREPSSFTSADNKVKTYLGELEQAQRKTKLWLMWSCCGGFELLGTP